MRRDGLAAIVATAIVLVWAGLGSRPVRADVEPAVDRLFSPFTASTPGCAVGVGRDGTQVFARGYGMADLEHDVPITAETIFEAGSVSKQFTAAAVLLLAREGKLSLDDTVRRYLPEVPDYGSPITIRQLLTHTSGLRDWGSVESIAGWPRTTRAYTHPLVLEIVARQRSLNFPPGTHWSYSNTGYNLAAMIVSRVAGMSFVDFTRSRLFEPLGMTHTSWRDDYTRIVKQRAIAYAGQNGIFRTSMPFENVYGNGGLLTTVGDLLKWNENFWSPTVGDAAFLAEEQRPVTFTGGSGHGYALGLMVGDRRGVRQAEHSGSTAGYLAHLARYPDQHVSVAVLCNVSSAEASERAYDVADIYLAERARLAPPSTPATLQPDDLAKLEGVYRSRLNGEAITLIRQADGLRIKGGAALIAQSATRFVTDRQTWEFDGHGDVRVSDRFDSVDYERVPAAQPNRDELGSLTGIYVSDEAEITLRLEMADNALVLTRRPDTHIPLTPIYRDAFDARGLGTVIFRRDTTGRIAALSVMQDRVWDLRFMRQPPQRSDARQ